MKKRKIVIMLVATVMVMSYNIPSFAAGTDLSQENAEVASKVIVETNQDTMVVPTFATGFASMEGEYDYVSQNNTVNVQQMENLTNESIERIVPNDESEVLVDEIIEAKEINGKLIEELGSSGHVEVEQINDEEIFISVNIEEPSSTIVYENGFEVEQREAFGLIVENETELPTEDYVKELETIVEDASKETVAETPKKTSFLHFNIIEPVYAAYSDRTHQVETYNETSKIKLRKRIIYHFASMGGGGTVQNWYRIIRSSSYIMSSEYKLKSLQMKSEYSGFVADEPNGKATVVKDSKNGSVISSPELKKYYILKSPISKWFNEYLMFTYKTNTIIKYVKDGETKTKTFTIKLSR